MSQLEELGQEVASE